MTPDHFSESARMASRSSAGEPATTLMPCGTMAATKRGSTDICLIALDSLSITAGGRFAGPNIPNAGLARLLAIAGPKAIVERSRADFAALLAHAYVSISQAGYNTTLDVMASGARPVVVPFTGNGETEQRARGERLRAFDLAVVVDDRTLTPEGLAAAVDLAGTRTSFGRFDFASDGAARSAALVEALLDAREERARAAGEETPVAAHPSQ